MFHKLKLAGYDKAKALFKDFDYSLSLLAAIEGNNPGWIFVDDVENPQTALALTVEGYLLTGKHDDPAILDALGNLFKEQIFSGTVDVNADWCMYLAVHPETWREKLPAFIPTHEVERIERYHYLCTELTFDWRKHLQEPYTVRRLNKDLLEDKTITFTEDVQDWFDPEDNWGNPENFFEKGISYCVLYENQVVSLVTPDCVAGNRMDIGIITDPEHRQRNLAAIATAATVEQCFRDGMTAVGWHCNDDNIGSWKTAVKVGFKRIRNYAYYYYIYDPIDHMAELGWHYFQKGDFQKTAQYYDQFFTVRDENPDYFYHLAAIAWAEIGNEEKALLYLQTAVKNGWKDEKWTMEVNAFAPLYKTSEWPGLVNQIQLNAKKHSAT